MERLFLLCVLLPDHHDPACATYGHVIRSDEDRVRAIVDASLGGSAEDWLRTKAIGA
jgi:hypothetical protein